MKKSDVRQLTGGRIPYVADHNLTFGSYGVIRA